MDDSSRLQVAGKIFGGRRRCRAWLVLGPFDFAQGWFTNASVPTRTERRPPDCAGGRRLRRCFLVSRWGYALVSAGQRYSDAAFIVYARGCAPIHLIGADHAVSAAG